MPAFRAAEQANQNRRRQTGHDRFCRRLRIGQAVQRIRGIQKEQRRNLQDNLAHDGENQRKPSISAGLKHAHRQEVNSQEHEG